VTEDDSELAPAPFSLHVLSVQMLISPAMWAAESDILLALQGRDGGVGAWTALKLAGALRRQDGHDPSDLACMLARVGRSELVSLVESDAERRMRELIAKNATSRTTDYARNRAVYSREIKILLGVKYLPDAGKLLWKMTRGR